jgi:nucleoside-diphosphate-sugar epimerase
MKVLVCGSEGSLMQAVIPKLIEKGHEVVGVDNLVRYGERLGHAGNDYEFLYGDLCDPSFVNRTFENIKPDYVIQAAARIYGILGFNLHCADILGENTSLHTNVLKASVANKVKRVVYISSSMVYESCPNSIDEPLTEDAPEKNPMPITSYGQSKYVGEKLSEAYFTQYGLEYTIWRPFNIITPYEKSEYDDIGFSHVFSDYIKNLVAEKMNPLPIIGDGTQVRCFTWIDDVAQAIVDWSFEEKTKNDIFNLSNPEPIMVAGLARLIHQKASEIGLLAPIELKFETVKDIPNDVMVRIPSNEKAKQVLGFESNHKVEESIVKCLKHTFPREFRDQ